MTIKDLFTALTGTNKLWLLGISEEMTSTEFYEKFRNSVYWNKEIYNLHTSINGKGKNQYVRITIRLKENYQ